MIDDTTAAGQRAEAADTTETTDRESSFTAWVTHFRDNVERQHRIEREVDWSAPCALTPGARRAFAHSFQRFELGEDGDGAHLLALARKAGDPVYTEALALLVAEEQRHSKLFRRGLLHLGAPSLSRHWTDVVFTRLRRLLGLRTELALFLIAETVSLGWFEALASQAPDPVLRGVGRRILTDEVDHVRFQCDRLGLGFRATPLPARIVVGAGWSVVAVGATAVLLIDHRAALAACGLHPVSYGCRAFTEFARAAWSVLGRPSPDRDQSETLDSGRGPSAAAPGGRPNHGVSPQQGQFSRRGTAE
ncbi:ferritin-like domain-containing protein [Frondihabitans sp. PAMC 28766]|uniref:ferritin-like domain-containing protein n=1 Tax=Frondihabitans sp. PAMC 28766 TaxID=1795630 RepID=UPI0012FFD0F5|nr:ferritin-like domain-containing protein [Frondihabitans sp. PAMC 28766]